MLNIRYNFQDAKYFRQEYPMFNLNTPKQRRKLDAFRVLVLVAIRGGPTLVCARLKLESGLLGYTELRLWLTMMQRIFLASNLRGRASFAVAIELYIHKTYRRATGGFGIAFRMAPAATIIHGRAMTGRRLAHVARASSAAVGQRGAAVMNDRHDWFIITGRRRRRITSEDSCGRD